MRTNKRSSSAKRSENTVIFDDLIELVRILREKCPWDRIQTLDSLKGKLIEEAYELVDAIEQGNLNGTVEELGDIIFLAFFLTRILEEDGKTTAGDVLASTIKKYEKKHPHVFADKKLKDENEVLQFWHESKGDIFAGVPLILPALLAAKVIQERAARLGFDWASHTGPLEKVVEEFREVEKSGRETRVEEMGDLLFACVNLARHLNIDPEEALRHANKKFVRRFRAVMEELRKQGKDSSKASLEEMDKIWDEIKRDE
jgi:tetrapyrrole methylase family protein/MazG family protein